MNIKLTPFLLFLIILGVLVISMLFGNWFIFNNKEGFVSFQNNNPSTYGQYIYIPQYSKNNQKKVLSLYDNLYYDSKNGCIIEVDSPACSRGNVKPTNAGEPNCNDTTGKYITSIYVTDRLAEKMSTYKNSNSNYVFENIKYYDTSESLNENLSSSYNYFTYTTKSPNTNTYQLFYVSWNTDTYIHIMDIENKTMGSNVISYMLNKNGILDSPVKHLYSTQNVPPFFSKPIPNLGNTSNTSYIDTDYFEGKNIIYELTSFVKYDYKNGYVLISKPGNKYDIYPRDNNGSIASNAIDNNKINNEIKFNSWSISDGNNGMVIVMVNKSNTLIYIVNSLEYDDKYQIISIRRFNENGLINEVSSTTSKPTSTSKSTTNPKNKAILKNKAKLEAKLEATLDAGDATSGMNSKVCGDELSCKWYWFYNTIGLPQSKSKDNVMQIEDKMESKCEYCPVSGNCTNCGSNNNSGTKSNSGITTSVKGSIIPNQNPDFLKPESGSNPAKNANITNGPVDNYSYFGALPPKGGDYIPIVNDFSAFRK